MRGFFCMPEPRVWRGEALHRADDTPQSDPYGSTAPGYRERTRQTVTALGGGLSRVDLGEPVSRLSGEPQAIPVASEAEPETVLQDAPAAPASPPASLAAIDAATRDWRADYGLSKRS